MRSFLNLLVSGLIAFLAAAPAAAQSRWSLSGAAGLSAGNQTEASFTWWGSLHRWVASSVGLGLEAGRHRWNGLSRTDDRIRVASGLPFYSGIAHGGQELQHLSASLRLRGGRLDLGSAPMLSLSAGVYRQVIRHPEFPEFAFFPAGGREPRDGELHPGFSVAIGGIKTNGIGPGAEFRFDMANTRPGPTAYFTAALSLHVNR